jgi:hypothetical protein
MSGTLNLEDRNRPIRKGPPQALTCEDPSHRRDDCVLAQDKLLARGALVQFGGRLRSLPNSRLASLLVLGSDAIRLP